MSRLRVLVADDEPLALEMTRELVERDAELEVVGTASDGSRAVEEIERLAPDIVLLDIEMPEASGLEAVRRLEASRLPVFIFVTAYDRYATEAFEVEALDYVLKPVSERRLSEALERAKRRVRERRLSGVAEQVATLTAGIGGVSSRRGERKVERGYLRRLPVATGGRTRFVDVSEILWIESEDYYVRLHTRRGGRLLRATLQSLEERLDPGRFCRVHRGAIVQLGEVEELRTLSKGGHALLLSDGTRVRVSRGRWARVQGILAPRLRKR